MPINYPSLSELTATAQHPGLGPTINAGVSGLTSGIQAASDIQARKQALLNKMQELGIMQQQANTGTQQANTQQQAVSQQMVDPGTLSTVLSGGTPTGPVNGNVADAIMKVREQAATNQANNARIAAENEQARLSREQIASEGDKTRAANAALQSSTAANAQLETAAKNKEAAHSWLPWDTPQEKTAAATYDYAAQRAGMTPATGSDKVGTYLSQMGAKDTPANRAWAQTKLGSK